MIQITPKLFSWASIIDFQTLEQARKSSTMPFIYPYLALMPDAHLGKGATVGSVIPTVGAIMPAAVGVDIGCGMMAICTQFYYSDLDGLDLSKLHAAISSAVPLSAGNYNDSIRKSAKKRIDKLEALDGAKQAWEASSKTPWTKQLGSLGSGNHFIEISVDEKNRIWLFLHSGSRGVGNRLASTHIEIAKKACTGIKLPSADLAYLTEGTQEFSDYIRDLRWAQTFALLNREEMMDRVIECFESFIGSSIEIQEEVNCHHNYTEFIKSFDNCSVDVWLSRKGAINAEEGKPGLIPGSMGDKSYVVRGLGNSQALWSAPHGAGRVYSRSAAKGRFTLEDLTARMGDVVWGNSSAFLDEHPSAYKDIDVVIRDAADLVTIEHTLRQIVNVKGN